MSSQAGPYHPSSAPTPGPDLVRLRTVLCVGQVAVDHVAAQAAPMPSNASPAEMRVRQQFHGMRRPKERGDQVRVKLVLRQTPNIMVSQVIQVTPEGESTRQGCKRR